MASRLICDKCGVKSAYVEIPANIKTDAGLKKAALALVGWVEDCPKCDPPKKSKFPAKKKK